MFFFKAETFDTLTIALIVRNTSRVYKTVGGFVHEY